jgi:N-acyl-phosphatidylethanolamine-hydrolysing phospholipase D
MPPTPAARRGALRSNRLMQIKTLAQRWWRRCACAAAAALALSACANEPAAVAGQAPHHRDSGFQNNYVEFSTPGLAAFMRWKFQAWRDGLPAPPASKTPAIVPDLGLIQTNAKAGVRMVPTVTWIGHATVLVQLGGLNVLTDPIFSNRASPLSFIGPERAQKPGLWLHELPHIDLVLISHNHYDHLDDDSVKALAKQAGGPPLFVVPLGLKAWFAKRDIARVVELDWWQSHRLGDVEIVLTPVQHWSGRSPIDRMDTLWGGYALFAPELHLFFAGDTGYSKDFADIRERFAERHSAAQGGGFDIALLPIGAYEPRWFMQRQHVNPEEAVRIHRDLGAKASLGIHWGTFGLTDESLDEPPRQLAQARRSQAVADSAFFTLAIGQTRRLAPRRPRS